jgi:hypothetical protein
MRLVFDFMGSECTDLVIPFDGRYDRGAKSSRHADAESTNHAANEKIPDHVLLSPSSRVQSSENKRSPELLGSHLGATKTAITIDATIMTLPNTINPTERNIF